MKSTENEFEVLQGILRDFAQRRNWEQFHTPKNLAMAVAGEAGELVAEFQWMTADESSSPQLSLETRQAIEFEIADVQIYLLRLADVLGIDVPQAVRRKIEINETRFLEARSSEPLQKSNE